MADIFDEVDQPESDIFSEEDSSDIFSEFESTPEQEDMTPEEMQKAENLAFRQRHKANVANAVSDYEDPTFLEIAKQTGEAMGTYLEQPHGWLDKTFYTLTAAEQFMARQAVNVMREVDVIDPEEAKFLLSADELHGSDLVNAYWKPSDSKLKNAGRFVAGLAADIMLDPLSYLGIGALTKAGKTAQVMGKTVTGLDKMGKAERAMVKSLNKVEAVVKNGSLKGAEKSNIEILEKAAGRSIGVEDLKKGLLVDDSARSQIDNIFRESGEVGYFDELASGERGVTLGVRVPFSNLGFEVDLPGAKFFTKPTGKMISAISDKAGEFSMFMKKANLLGPLGRPVRGAARWLSDLKTKTGFSFFDDARNKYLGAKSVSQQEWGTWEKEWTKRVESLGLTETEARDLIDEVELGLDTEEVLDTLNRAGKPALRWDGTTLQTTDNFNILARNAEDEARLRRLQSRPELLDLVKEIREQNKSMRALYEYRKIPFQELNVFGKDWAKSYIKHMISRDWIDRFSDLDEAAMIADDFMQKTFGAVDDSIKGRKFRETINIANDKSMKEHGIKIFVDNPIELHATRMKEMERVIANYDLMDAAAQHAVVGKAPGPGYVKFSLKNWKNYMLEVPNANLEGKVDDTIAMFVPEFYKKNKHIYLPELVHDRLLHDLNKRAMSSTASDIWAGWEAYNTLVRKFLLSGPGYQGQNLMSNITTYLTAGVKDPIRSMASSIKTLIGKSDDLVEFVDASGNKISMTQQELVEEAIRRNVLRSGLENELNLRQIAQGIASNKAIRDTFLKRNAKRVGNGLVEITTLWGTNRIVAQWADDLPKFALFMDRLKQGYTLDGAAEAAERYFYNYNNISRSFEQARTMYPFLTYPMKTLELAVHEIANGKIGRMTVPYKVKEVLLGSFVEDEETQSALNELMPSYNSHSDQIHSILMPGAREVVMEMPWAKNAMSFFADVDSSIHPAFQIASAVVSRDIEEEENFTFQEKFMEKFNNFAREITPPIIRHALTVAELNGSTGYGTFYADPYLPKIPAADAKPDSPGFEAFENSYEFAEYLHKRKGENWLYDLVFSDRLTPSDGTDRDEQMLMAGSGEYIRKHFRDISMGLSRMNAVDKNFFIRDLALSRQAKKLKDRIVSDAMKTDALVNKEFITSEQGLRKMAKNNDLAKKFLSMQYKRKALKEYYNFVLQVGQEAPETDLFGIMTGTHGVAPQTLGKEKPVYYEDLIRSPGLIGDVDLGDLNQEAYGFNVPELSSEEEAAEEDSDLFDDEDTETFEEGESDDLFDEGE